MPGPSRRSEAAEFLRRKRARDKAEFADGAPQQAPLPAPPSPAPKVVESKDFADALRQIRAFVCRSDER